MSIPPNSLLAAIESQVKSVQTQALDLSMNEILDMYKNREINIQPEYQRLFQWSEGARSRFIESLLLEMPVPPFFVIEVDEGRYELIDGLQRISSYLHFRGELTAPHLDPPITPGQKLVLSDCDIVPALNGKTFEELGATLQIRAKRAFIRVEVIRQGSDPKFRYHMFKRLNTGGTILSEQQLRNCTIRLLDPTFNDFINRLSSFNEFERTTESLTQQHRLEAFDQELVLRFFAFKNDRKLFKHDVADFLTEYMEKVTDRSSGTQFDYDTEETCFRKTFAVLANTLEDRAFSFAGKKATSLTKSFSVYHFEALTIGIQKHLAALDPADRVQMDKLRDALLSAKLDYDFIEITTGGGKNSPGPLRQRIEFIEKAVGEAVGK